MAFCADLLIHIYRIYLLDHLFCTRVKLLNSVIYPHHKKILLFAMSGFECDSSRFRAKELTDHNFTMVADLSTPTTGVRIFSLDLQT